ncbi:hypothetical protein IWQ56_005959 [Coemansia nantahalensis]|nr:hypothetical protein IWQ56_005959 [Coemansia nantahalensis]
MPTGPSLAAAEFLMPQFGVAGSASPLTRQVTVPMPGGSHRMPDPQECHGYALLEGRTHRMLPAGFATGSNAGGEGEGGAYADASGPRAGLDMPMPMPTPDFAELAHKLHDMEATMKEFRAMKEYLRMYTGP